jgi:hypothetical protein
VITPDSLGSAGGEVRVVCGSSGLSPDGRERRRPVPFSFFEDKNFSSGAGLTVGDG